MGIRGTVVGGALLLALAGPSTAQASTQDTAQAGAGSETRGLWPDGFSAQQRNADCGRWQVDENRFCVANDTRNGVELGVRFEASRDVEVTGIRFYRADPAALTVSLWDAAGTRLAQAPVPEGRANRWRDVAFAEPVTVSPGQTYTASYFSPGTKYAFRYEFFADRAHTVGPVTALRSSAASPNGVHCYDDAPCASYPVQPYRSSTYWITPLWRHAAGDPEGPGPGAPPSPAPATPPTPPPGTGGDPTAEDRTAPRVTQTSPARRERRVRTAAKVRVAFSEPVRSASLTARSVRLLRKGSARAVRVRIRTDATGQRVVLRPRGGLRPGTGYHVVVGTGLRDLAGNRLDQDPGKAGRQGVAWTFRTR